MINQKEKYFNDAVILITGGSGSWGNELTKQLLNNYSPKEIRIYSRGEHKQVEMKRKFQDPRVKFYVGDVRDRERVLLVSKNVDYIFHLAALKHVPVCEENPYEAVQTNIIGTQNVIDAAIINKVKKFIDVSTDKAVDPFNLYGVTKACGEKLVIAANLINDDTKFVCVRGGNVLGTNGSVVPLFREQLQKMNEITITDEQMTRFLMRVEEAIELVIYATVNSVGGEVFVMKMPTCKIIDLAQVMINKFGNSDTIINNIGVRPGEKLYEVLVSRYEVPRAYDYGRFFVILPQLKIIATEQYYRDKLSLKLSTEEFNSNNAEHLEIDKIEDLLNKDHWLDVDKDSDDYLSYLKSLDKTVLLDYFKSEGWTTNDNK
jgi:FlaA1/EpsC-like NDP-sugar epimerase